MNSYIKNQKKQNKRFSFLYRYHEKKFPFLFYLALSFALIGWIFTIGQYFSKQIFTTKDAIPAYKTGIQATSSSSCSVKNFLSDENTKKELLSYLQKKDPSIQLIASHKEKNYTDFYFYSPLLADSTQKKTQTAFNLQVAVTKDTIYFGSPFITTTF